MENMLIIEGSEQESYSTTQYLHHFLDSKGANKNQKRRALEIVEEKTGIKLTEE